MKKRVCTALLATAALLTGCFGQKAAETAVSAAADGTLTVGIIDGQDVFAAMTDGDYRSVSFVSNETAPMITPVTIIIPR